MLKTVYLAGFIGALWLSSQTPATPALTLARAAPDLLDACKVALGYLTGGTDGDWRDCDPVELLRSVIEKAQSR